MTPVPRLSSVHVYPVKSARGLALGESAVEPWGLAGDRRWMVVDGDGKVITQREQPRLALVTAEPQPGGGLRLSASGGERLDVPAPVPDAGTVRVRIWRDEVEAVPAPDTAHKWFSRRLGTQAALVHLADPARQRPIDPEYAGPGETVSLADGYPLLVTTTASLAALDGLTAGEALAAAARPSPPLPMDRFRPNAVISGTAAWEEDGWRRVRIGEVTFRVTKPCGRCVVTTTDQATAERGAEPLRTLARHRRIGGRLVFGQNLVPERTGTLRVGDAFTVLE